MPLANLVDSDFGKSQRVTLTRFGQIANNDGELFNHGFFRQWKFIWTPRHVIPSEIERLKEALQNFRINSIVCKRHDTPVGTDRVGLG